MYFHVIIYPTMAMNRSDTLLDLTIAQLTDRILNPYFEGRLMMVGGRAIDPCSMWKIKITSTEQPSAVLLPGIRQERARSRVVTLLADEWVLANRATDVTDTYVTQPPGSRVSVIEAKKAHSSVNSQDSKRGAIEVFFSYSHKDEELRDQLANHVSLLKNEGKIKDWHDRRIGSGTEWKGQIDQHLDQAHIILFLVSSDFLASPYCYDVELK